jgi:PAS domain S-box-containing protein
MNLEYILNNLITSGIPLSDPDVVRKFKVLNIFQLVVIMLAPILGLFYFYIGAAILFYSSVIAGLLMIAGVIMLRRTKNVLLVGNYAIFVLWVEITIISWNTGAISFEGIINPSWLLNAGLILLAIFLNGYLSGTIWASIVFVQTGVVISMYRAGHRFISIIPPEITATYSMGTYLICLLAILLFAFLYEKEKTEALIREQEKSHTIRESKKYMDEIFDKYPLPTFVLDSRHRVVQWNKACSELSGIGVQEILGKRVWDGFTSGDQGSIADMIMDDIDYISQDYGESIVSQSDSGVFELDTYLPRLRQGEHVIVTAALLRGDDGVIRGAIQTIQEVSRIPMEGGKETDTMDENFVKPVFRVDSKGKIDFWNKASEGMFGYSSQQMMGKSPLSVVAKKYRPLFKDMLIKVFRGETFARREFRYQNASGKPIYVMAMIFPSKVTDEGDMECVIINTDITDLRLKLKKLTRYASESGEKLKTLSEEYNLLKKNIAAFIRKKDDQDTS